MSEGNLLSLLSSMKIFMVLGKIRAAILENLREDAKLGFRPEDFADEKLRNVAIAVSTVDDGEEEVGKSGCVPSAAVSFPLLGEEDMKAWKAGTVPPSVPKNQFKFVNDTIRRTAAEMVAEKPAARCARVRIDRMKVMSETPEFILLIMGFTVTVE